MRVVRNIAWGVLSTCWFMALAVMAMALLFAFSSEARSQVVDFGGPLRFLLSFVPVALATGVILGALRPLGKSRLGRHTLGGVVTMAAFSTQFLVLGGFEFWRDTLIGLPAMFIVGFLMAPLWYHGARSGNLGIPNFSAWLGSIVHTTSHESTKHE